MCVLGQLIISSCIAVFDLLKLKQLLNTAVFSSTMKAKNEQLISFIISCLWFKYGRENSFCSDWPKWKAVNSLGWWPQGWEPAHYYNPGKLWRVHRFRNSCCWSLWGSERNNIQSSVKGKVTLEVIKSVYSPTQCCFSYSCMCNFPFTSTFCHQLCLTPTLFSSSSHLFFLLNQVWLL